MYCKNCGSQMDQNAEVCSQCGVAKNAGLNYCANCGGQLAPGAAFCTNCGVGTAPGEGNPAYGQNNQQNYQYNYQQNPQQNQPYANSPYSTGQQKSRIAAGLLGIFLGGLGIHNFYLGYTNKAVIQIVVFIVTCGVGSLWGLIEGILILTSKNGVDANGIPLSD